MAGASQDVDMANMQERLDILESDNAELRRAVERLTKQNVELHALSRDLQDRDRERQEQLASVLQRQQVLLDYVQRCTKSLEDTFLSPKH
jgi:16S rRNA U1498 N3-methylase RsmE